MPGPNMKRATRVMAASVVFAAVGAVTVAQSASALPSIAVAAGLQVVRAGADANTLAITWKPVTGASRYTVNVFDGVNQFAYNVPATTTSFSYVGSGNCTRYRVVVNAVDAAGGSSATGAYLVPPLAPGGLTALSVDRSNDGGTVALKWGSPAAGSSFEPVANYAVNFRNMADGTVLTTRATPATDLTVTALDPARTYVTEIVPTNRFGSCAPSKILVRGPQASPATAVKAVRDEHDSNAVNVSWVQPTWTGYGAVGKMQVGYRGPNDAAITWVDQPADATAATLKLDSAVDWSVWVRAVNVKGVNGETTSAYTLTRASAVGTPVVDPRVSIQESSGVVKVSFDGPVGSSATYPNMNVAIAPTALDSGFSANQDAFNRAQTFTFDKVPCGAFTVVVTGYGPNASQEFGRKMINYCNDGAVPSSEWKTTGTGGEVKDGQVRVKGEKDDGRALSTIPRTSPDMVSSTDATLEAGSGDNIFARASEKEGAGISAYAFRYDPGNAAVDPTFGKAISLRVWQDGQECRTPLAVAKWPAALEVNASHRVAFVTKGDTAFATIDGYKVFAVPSLKAALVASGCSVGEPTGAQLGFSAVGAQGSATFRNTTLNGPEDLAAQAAAAQAKADAEAKAKAEAEVQAKVKAEAEAQAKIDAEVKTKADAEARAIAASEAAAKAQDEADAALAAAKAKVIAEEKAAAEEAAAKSQSKADEAAAKAKAEAAAKAAADAKADAAVKTDNGLHLGDANNTSNDTNNHLFSDNNTTNSPTAVAIGNVIDR